MWTPVSLVTGRPERLWGQGVALRCLSNWPCQMSLCLWQFLRLALSPSVCLPVSFSVSLGVSQSHVSVSGLTTHRPPASCSVTSHARLLACMRAKSHQLYLTLCDLMDCSLPGSSVHGVLQAGTLEWVAIPFSRGSSRPRDRTCVCQVSCIGRRVLYHWHHLGSPETPPKCHALPLSWLLHDVSVFFPGALISVFPSQISAYLFVLQVWV